MKDNGTKIIFKAKEDLYLLMGIFMMVFGQVDYHKDKEYILVLKTTGVMKVIGIKVFKMATENKASMMELIIKVILKMEKDMAKVNLNYMMADSITGTF
jgi:hypothetical protein